MYARTYAQVVGVWFLTLGVIGVVIGPREDWFLGFNVDVVSDVVHFATGGLLAYAGFSGTNGQARSIVAAVGAFYLLASVLGLLAADLFGLLPHGLSVQDKVGGIVLGLVAFWAERGAPAAPPAPRSGAPA